MKDPTEFKQRFVKWKAGEQVYEAGLPKYESGRSPYDDTIDFLKQYEGFKDTTYLDGNGIPTIGYGFTDSSLVQKGTISQAEADKRLVQEIENREKVLAKLKHWDKLNEGSKTALRSYYYNYPAGFKDTTKFMKAWNSGNYEEAIRQVDAGINDKKNPGLRSRRLAEQQLLMQDPFLRPLKPKSQFVRTLEDTPQYKSDFEYRPPVSTDYSITNRAGGMLNAWNGGLAPNYGGANVRVPSIKDLQIPTFR